MLRISFRGQSFVDGQEFPLRVVFDVETEAQLREQAQTILLNFLEEMDWQVPHHALVSTLEMEVIQLWPVR